jgi:hypothetical protein
MEQALHGSFERDWRQRSSRSPIPDTQPLAAGFVHVVECKFALPGNAWAKGKRDKTLELMQMTNIAGRTAGVVDAAIHANVGLER